MSYPSGKSSIYQQPNIYTGWKSGEGGYQKEAVVAWGGEELSDTARGLKSLADVPAAAGWSLFKGFFWILLIAVIIYLIVVFGPTLLKLVRVPGLS